MRPDPMEIAARLVGDGSQRRAATMVSVTEAIAMAERIQALDLVALLSAEHLAALAQERAAVMFAGPAVIAAHDALARGLAALGYVHLQAHKEEKTDGQESED